MTKTFAAWRLLALIAVALLGSGFMSSSAKAQGTDTATFQVQANVPDICTISAAGAMDFTTYDPFSLIDNDLGTTTVSVTCTPGTAYEVGLDNGMNGVRLMDNAGATLAYEIYTDFGRTTRWDDVGGANTNSDPSFAAPSDVYTAYGRMTAGQAVTATGAYTDTITATVSF